MLRAATSLISFCALISIAAGDPQRSSSENSEARTERDKSPPVFAHRFRFVLPVEVEKIEVYMDGASVGTEREAELKLAKMTFPEGAKLQIDLVDVPEGRFEKDKFSFVPVFLKEDFLRNWITQGVKIEFLVNGRPKEIHTLVALDKEKTILDPNYAGTFDANTGLTFGRFIFDGKECTTVEDTAYAMGAAPWTNQSILIACYPNEGTMPYKSGKPTNGIETVLRFLAAHSRIREWGLGLRRP